MTSFCSYDLANAPIGFSTIRLEHKRLPGYFHIHGYCFPSDFTPSCPEGTSPLFLHLFASGVPRCPCGTFEVTLVSASPGTKERKLETKSFPGRDLLQHMLMWRSPARPQRPEGWWNPHWVKGPIPLRETTVNPN